MKSKKFLMKRIYFITSIFLICISIIIYRLAYIQLGEKSSFYVSKALNQYNLQYKTSNLNYRIVDQENVDLIDYDTKYIVEIKSNIFKNFNNNIEMEKIFTVISILKNFNEQFNLIEKFEKNPNYNFKFEVDKYTYDKLKTLGDIKGIHLYEYNEFNDKEAWAIENILVKEINDKTSLDVYHEYLIDNKYPIIDFTENKFGESVINSSNNNLKLTLDKKMQNGVENIIRSDKYGEFDGISVAISKASTGEIKILTQKNEFNPNIMLGSTTLGYVPGSIFKLIVAEAAIDSGLFSKYDKISCDNSRYHLCRNGTHGNLNVGDALAVSCNNIFAEIGRVVGWDFILSYAKEQGMFKKVLNFSDFREVNGSYVEPKEYEDGPLLLSMGQNMLIEPLQSLNMINTILNGGIYKKLKLVDEIVNENNEVIKTFNYDSKRVLKESTALSLKEMLINTVKNGTGKNISISDVETGVKTGTTERFDGEEYVSDGWVLGYFKHRNEYYSMCVFVENINEKGQFGGNTAGPIFKEIVEYYVANF